MKKIENIAYMESPEQSQYLDLYLPDGKSFPVFVYFHGGGLEAGDKSHEKVDYEYLATQGIAVVTANYRMYPEAHYPDFLEDASAAIKWTIGHISEYGKPTGIYVGGTSAGGYISMMLCFDGKWLSSAGVDGGMIAGWVHDAGQPTVHYNVLRERKVDTRRVIVDDAAPLYHIDGVARYAPMLFIISDNDMQNRYEQTMLTLSTLKHFGYGEGIVSLKKMHGTHCQYIGKTDECGESIFGKIVAEFIKQ